MNNPEIIFNLVRLIKQGTAPCELINDFDYSHEDVNVALRVISYVETCNKPKEAEE